MKIKKGIIYGCLGLLSIGLGLFLFVELVKALGQYGLKGYVILGIFIVSLILYLGHEFDVKTRKKLADETSEQIISEYKEKFSQVELAELKKQLSQHLKSKIYDEKFNIFCKK